MRKTKWNIGLIREIVVGNNLTKMSELKDMDMGAYLFVVRNDLAGELGLKKRRYIDRKTTGKVYEPDITKVWVYLAKWAVGEGKTMRRLADELGYYKQYNEWVRENGVPVPEDFLSEEDINKIKNDYEKRESSL